MKNKLMLAVTLLTVGVATNVKAEEQKLEQNSNANFEQINGDKELYDEDGQRIYVYPFKEGDKEIKVWLPYGSSVKLYRKTNNEENLTEKSQSKASYGDLVELEYDCYERKDAEYSIYDTQSQKTRAYFRDGYTSNFGRGQEYKIPLKSPFTKEQHTKINELKSKLEKGESIDKCPVKQEREDVPIKQSETLTFVFGSNGFYIGTKTYQYPKKVDNSKLSQEQNIIPENKGEQDADTLTKNNNLSNTSPEVNNAPSNENSQTNQNTQQPTGKNNAENKTWTQRAKERINKAWERFKYYINPKNWFNRWRS
ncbi:hypothetical protein K6973_02660 [Streptococcus dysgalactiae]|uniref:hypothetical protein n=1 Tax=Streptococcus dysgalactiae TaxID=1334 RepID=UPI001C9D694D|nr:hypothetical protein [Streptococcus dysgalactiae]QZT27664.1 hypothetical protein K6973_02660 [Streptococcus dysgalactiae]